MNLPSEQLRHASRIIQLILNQFEVKNFTTGCPIVLLPGGAMRREGFSVASHPDSDDFEKELEAVTNELNATIECINYLSGKTVVEHFELYDFDHKRPNNFYEIQFNKFKESGLTLKELRDNFALEILIPSLSSAARKLEEAERKIEDLLNKKVDKKNNSKLIELYLNQVGDLWREPKKKYCYSMDEKSDRHKIVRFLVKNRGYNQTAVISRELEGKKEQSIRAEIGKIRNKMTNLLKIKGEKVIEGRKESGYRINPAFKIVLKNG